jgi:hypothetical protein
MRPELNAHSDLQNPQIKEGYVSVQQKAAKYGVWCLSIATCGVFVYICIIFGAEGLNR